MAAAVARQVAALRAVRGTVPPGLATWLLVVVPLVGLFVCEPTGFGDDFLVDLLWRDGGVYAEVVLIVQGCQALGQRQAVPEVPVDRGGQLVRGQRPGHSLRGQGTRGGFLAAAAVAR